MSEPARQHVRPEYEIGAADAKRLAEAGSLTIVDIREVAELKLASVEGVTHIPTSEFASRIDELMDLADEAGPEGLALMCHAGVRSFQATMLLRQEGVTNVRSLAGGIDAWTTYCDPSVPRYPL